MMDVKRLAVKSLSKLGKYNIAESAGSNGNPRMIKRRSRRRVHVVLARNARRLDAPWVHTHLDGILCKTMRRSDRSLKRDIEKISEAEEKVARKCKKLLRKYRWKDSVKEKGDSARIHFGIIAQDLENAFKSEGLDAGDYGMFIKNIWWEKERVIPAVEAVEAVDAVYDEEDNLISPAVEAVEAKDEETVVDTFYSADEAPEGSAKKTRRGVRYSELLAFIISAI